MERRQPIGGRPWGGRDRLAGAATAAEQNTVIEMLRLGNSAESASPKSRQLARRPGEEGGKTQHPIKKEPAADKEVTRQIKDTSAQQEAPTGGGAGPTMRPGTSLRK